MSSFLGTGTSIFFGNTIRVSTELLVDLIKPIPPNDTITIEGSIITNDIRLTSSETNIGVNAGTSSAGQDNTFVGASAGQNNVSGDTVLGSDNTFIGRAAGQSNTLGSQNTFVGTSAGFANLDTDRNTFIGRSAGANNVGIANTFIGRFAGFSDTGASGNVNCCVGEVSGFSLTTGGNNTFMCQSSGLANTSGNNNVYIGRRAGNDIETGSDNVILGTNAGSNAGTAMTGCVLIGASAGATNATDNRLVIHNNNVDPPLIDGDFSVPSIQFNGAVTLGTTAAFPTHSINTQTAGGAVLVPAIFTGGIQVMINGVLQTIPFI